MRVLVVSQYFWPELFRINEVVAYLKQQGHEVTVITGWPNYPGGTVFDDFKKTPGAFNAFQGAEIVRVPLVPRGKSRFRLVLNYLSFATTATVLSTFKFQRRQFDVVLAVQLSPATAVLPAIILGRLKSIPVCIWVLDLWPESLEAVNAVRSRLVLRAVSHLVSWMYRRANLILGQSRSFVKAIRARVQTAEKVVYWPQWAEQVYEEDYPPGEHGAEARRFAGGFNVIYAGNIGDSQDFPSILSAAERLRHRPDIRLLIAGDGRAAEYVRSEIEQRCLSSTVFMLGHFQTARMPSILAAADALLISLKDDPLFAQTIPGRVQNCLRAGKPILAMLGGESAQVIHESEAGLVCKPGDYVALANNIEHLAGMAQSSRNHMGAAGRAFAIKEFDRKTLLDNLIACLTAL